MNKKLLCLYLLFFISLFSVSYGNNIPDTDWTVLVYMPYDNNLEGCDDEIGDPVGLVEMMNVKPSKRVKVLIQIDRSKEYYNGSIGNQKNWTGCKRLKLENGLLKGISDLGSIDSANPDKLKDFINWGIKKYPAKRYFLILADHGMAWQGYAADEEFDSTMTLSKLSSAILSGLSDTNLSKIDVIYFDACMMADLAVACALEDCAKVLVASEEIQLRAGYGYILTSLVYKPNMTPKELGVSIVNANVLQSIHASAEVIVTQTSINLSKVNAVVLALKKFTDLLIAKLNDHDKIAIEIAKNIKSSALSCKYFGELDTGGYEGLLDLKHFVEIFIKKTKYADLITSGKTVINTINGAVFYNKSGDEHSDANGFSIFLPIQKIKSKGFESALSNYSKIKLAKETNWDKLLQLVKEKLPNDTVWSKLKHLILKK